MANNYFAFRQFTLVQEHSMMRISTDACLQAAWTAHTLRDHRFRTILDIGAGTGVLGFMLQQAFPDAQIHFVEQDKEACKDLAVNISHAIVPGNCHFSEEDFLAFTPEVQIDLAICNPPYFSRQLLSDNERKNKVRHDLLLPKKALAERAGRILSEDGLLSIMYPVSEWEEWCRMAQNAGLHPISILTVKARPHKEPYLRMGIFSLKSIQEEAHQTITIREEGNGYSTIVAEWMRPYYL